MAAWGDTSGRGLRNQVGVIREMMFDVRWGYVAPWAAVGGARAAQVLSRDFAQRFDWQLHHAPDGVSEHYVGYWLIAAMHCKRLRALGAWGARARARP